MVVEAAGRAEVPERAWYVCMTKPRQERLAEARLAEQGFEVFLPVMCTWKRRADAWQQQHVVMFPRYAFVRPGRPEQAISPVRSTPGVSTLVSFGHMLACMRPAQLDALRELVVACAQPPSLQPFEAGARVLVAAGPLKGLQGLVSAVASERVTVMLGLLGREQRVTLAADQLIHA